MCVYISCAPARAIRFVSFHFSSLFSYNLYIHSIFCFLLWFSAIDLLIFCFIYSYYAGWMCAARTHFLRVRSLSLSSFRSIRSNLMHAGSNFLLLFLRQCHNYYYYFWRLFIFLRSISICLGFHYLDFEIESVFLFHLFRHSASLR